MPKGISKQIDNSKSLTEEQADIEWRKCQKSLLYYLTTYVSVQDAVSQQIIKWRPHPHLLELIDLVQGWADQPRPRKPVYIIILKSRQVYTTTTIAAIANWLCTFFESTRVFESSLREDDANEILGRSRFINNEHPEFLKLKLAPDQSSLLGFPSTHSRIRALPSTAGAGRSTDATMVFPDEWEYHTDAEKNFAAIKPTMDKGGLFIGASTVDKTNLESFPKSIWRGSIDGSNNFVRLFWDYYVVPNRTDETWEEDTKGLADWQKEGEYPRSEDEAMSVPKSTCYFDRDAIAQMMKECREPLETRHGDLVRIYGNSVAERKYVLAVDPSEGEYDPAVAVIADWRREEDVVAFRGKISIDQQARIIYELYEEYNKPFTSVERNAAGILLIEKLKEMGVRNWYFTDKGKKKEGWWTSGTSGGGGTRPVMLSDLAEDIAGRHMGIPMRDALSEFLSFSWIDGKPQAIRGAHDDWVMVHGILGQARKSFRGGEVRITSSKYRG